MGTKVVTYDFKFDYNMFYNDMEAFMQAHDLKLIEMDELCGLRPGATSTILNKREGNHKMDTWLIIANTMDIDVRTYFVLDV